MSTKHKDDDFDFPDQPVEPIAPPPVLPVVEEFKPEPVTVKPYDRTAWIKEHGPKPPTVGMRAMDFAIVGMFAVALVLIFKAWIWIVFS
jgi:hypothetical protein